MKTLKALSISLAAAAAFAGTASAQTVIHVAGSTAFRAPATAAMIDYLNSTSSRGVFAGYTGGSLLGAANAVLANGTIGAGGTATVIIETYWTGSLAGVVDLVAQNDSGTQYLDPSVIGATAIGLVNNSANKATVGSANNSTVYGGGVVIAPAAVQNSFPDLAFSDSHKATISAELATANLSAPIKSFTTIGQLATAVGGGTVVDSGDPTDAGNNVGANASSDGVIGVLGFQWAASKGAPAIPGNNISEQAVKTLLSSGTVDASLLTGVSGTGVSFFATGRNEDSGTRIDTFAEAQFGVTAAPKQYNSSFALFPANSTLNTEPNISWSAAGHSGFTSGGNVATAVGSTAAGGTKYLIGALGITDAVTAQNNGATLLSYSGVPYSVANVQNGLYTLWAYEHAYHLSTLGSAALTAVNAIADNVHDTDADVAGNGKHSAVSGDVSAGILYDGSFGVSRPVQPEGGPITHF